MNFVDVLLILAIAACVSLVFRRLIREKREEKTCCGCSGWSDSCSHCGAQPGTQQKMVKEK